MDSKNENILSKYTYFMFDGDGVLWNKNKALDGAGDLIKLLKGLGKEVFFVTNNATRSRKVIYEHAVNLGFNGDDGEQEYVSVERFYPSSYATALYCKTVINSKKAFIIGNGDGLNDEFVNQGIETVRVPQELIQNSRINDKIFSNMTVDQTIDTVVSGSYSWTYNLVGYTSLLIRGDGLSEGTTYICTSKDQGHSTGSRSGPAAGSVMKMISASSEVTPKIIAKPNKELFNLVINDQGLQDEPRGKFLMIGDKIDTDIAFGINSGIDTILVLSGDTREDRYEETQKMYKEYQPTYIFKSVKELLQFA